MLSTLSIHDNVTTLAASFNNQVALQNYVTDFLSYLESLWQEAERISSAVECRILNQDSPGSNLSKIGHFRSEWLGVKRSEWSDGFDTSLYKNIPLPSIILKKNHPVCQNVELNAWPTFLSRARVANSRPFGEKAKPSGVVLVCNSVV